MKPKYLRMKSSNLPRPLSKKTRRQEKALRSTHATRTLHAVNHHERGCEPKSDPLRQETEGIAQNQSDAEDNVTVSHHGDHGRSLCGADPTRERAEQSCTYPQQGW